MADFVPKNETSRDPIFYVGVTMVSVGALALLYLVISVTSILSAPAESDLVRWCLELVDLNEVILSGTFGDEGFELHASEAFQYVFLGLFGLIMVRLLTSIFMAFITEGAKLISPARRGASSRR